MKVRLVIEGSRKEVMAAVGICLEAGVLTAMQAVDESDGLPSLPILDKPKRQLTPKMERLKKFPYNTKIVVTKQRTDRPEMPTPGSTGRVIESRMSGLGVVLVLEMDDGARVEKVPSSMVEPV